MKYSYEDVKNFIKDNTDCALITLESEYKNGSSKLKLRCSCGEIFYRTFHSIRKTISINKKLKCKKCLHKVQSEQFKLTNEEAYKVIESKLPDDFEIYEFNYTGKYGLIKLRHECGEIIENSFHYFRNQKIVCACQKSNKKKNTSELNAYIKDKGYDDYEIIKYVNSKTIYVKHSCGHVFKRTFDNIRANGLKCPKCYPNQSTGAKLIEEYLKVNKIDYIKEKTFDDCRDVNLLPFDFYLPEYNTCIEFDGIQHFEPIDFFGGIEKFKICKLHDSMKNKYCNANEITLIRIPYTNIYNVNDILDKLIPR